MTSVYQFYLQEMQDWLNYLDIEEKYKNEPSKKKCILFVFLWMRYNEYYNYKYGNLKSDANKAKKIAEEEDVQIKYENLKGNFIKAFQETKEYPEDEERTWIKEIKTGKKIYYKAGEDTLKDFLTIIYKIRCNFFHGDKPPNEVNTKIIVWAYDCLNELLKDIIKSPAKRQSR